MIADDTVVISSNMVFISRLLQRGRLLLDLIYDGRVRYACIDLIVPRRGIKRPPFADQAWCGAECATPKVFCSEAVALLPGVDRISGYAKPIV
jgi:hypothetical protein